MPKKFSEAQAARVREQLFDAGRAQFARFGLRRTKVEDLARAAGIAKGTFYLFHDSKESLFLDVLLRLEAELRASLEEDMRRPFPDHRARFRFYLARQLEQLESHPLLAILTDPAEVMVLMRGGDPQRLEQARKDDERFAAKLLREWRRGGAKFRVPPSTLVALPRALLAISQQRQVLGNEVYPAVREFLLDAIARAAVEAGA